MTFVERKDFQKFLEDDLGVGPDQTMGEWIGALEELLDEYGLKPDLTIEECIKVIAIRKGEE